MPSNHDSIPSEVDVANQTDAAEACALTDSRPLTAALESVRLEVQRLEAIGELLEYAEAEWGHQQGRLRAESQRWQRSRQRLARHIARFRTLRRAAREERAAQGDAKDSDLSLLRDQLAETLAMLESTRDTLRHTESEHRQEVQQRSADYEQHAALVAQLREECQSLQEQLATARAAAAESSQSAPPRKPASLEGMSWEQRKAAVLEQLQREDNESEFAPGEKESLREMISKTDHELRVRDEEIAELRQLLEEQSTTLGAARGTSEDEPVAVGAAAFGHLFDADEMIREERDKLKEIRQEWEEKLRQSEIELSLERAKLARQRRELEQKQADLEEQLFRLSKDREQMAEGDNAGGGGSRPPQRRWLRQLGLGEGS